MRAVGIQAVTGGLVCMALFTECVLAAGFGIPIEDAAASMGIRSDVRELKLGKAVARELETENNAELCAAGAVVIDQSLEELTNSFRDLSLLTKGKMVVASGRISDDATLSDLESIPIPPADLEAISKVKPGNSEIKLSAREIEAIRSAGHAEAANAFKRSLLNRVIDFRQDGIPGLGTYDDKKNAVTQASVTEALLSSLNTTVPTGDFHTDEEFEYWAVEQFGGLKSFVSLTNMTIKRRPGAVRIETIQIYASHYCEGLVTAIDLHELPAQNGPKTLLRLTFRTQIDALGGLFGGLKRKVGRSKMVSQLAEGLERLKAEGPALARR